MTNRLKIIIWSFMGLSAVILGAGLHKMDSSTRGFFQPVTLNQIPDDVFPVDLPMKSIVIKYKKQKLDARYLKLEGSKYVALIAHDGTGNLYDRISLYEGWRDLNVSIMAFDYQGFGLSEGEEFSEDQLRLNARYVYHRLKHMRWRPKQIILYGQGLGATILADVGRERNCAGLIAENAISSLSDLSSGWFSRIILSERFDLIKNLEGTVFPTLFLQGQGYSGLPEEPLQRLVDKYPSQRTMVFFEGEDHRSLIDSHPDKWRHDIRQFLEKITSQNSRKEN
jgi:pimeloyl-ACP methyl ester carboxylesterase